MSSATDEFEDRLTRALSRSHFRGANAGSLRQDRSTLPDFSNVAAVGLDTNVLKQLGRDTIFANNLVSTLQSKAIPLIIPGQSVVEFWNNYQKFASDDAIKLQNEVNRLRGVIAKMGALSLAEGRLDEMQELVEAIVSEVKEATTAEYLDKARLMMELVLREALQPMVSRVRFKEIANARQGCKTPPGFADEAQKPGTGYGDFYVWCDFLMGSLSLHQAAGGKIFLFATDDAKPDWKTGKVGHPELEYEFRQVVDADLEVLSYSELKAGIQFNHRSEASSNSEL